LEWSKFINSGHDYVISNKQNKTKISLLK